MAERRMFTKKIIESDAFLDMPATSQVLYFHLNMAADDDGFVNNPKKIQRMVGSSDDDMKILIAKKFIIVFESGIIVIKHWKMHNYIQSDRYKPTDYADEKSSLEVKKNKAYTLAVSEMDTNCIQNVSVGKDRLGKVRLGKDIYTPPSGGKPSKKIYGAYRNVKLLDNELDKLKSEYGETMAMSAIELLSAYREEKGYKNRSDYLSIRRWVIKAVKEQQNGSEEGEDQKKKRTQELKEQIERQGEEQIERERSKLLEQKLNDVPNLIDYGFIKQI